LSREASAQARNEIQEHYDAARDVAAMVVAAVGVPMAGGPNGTDTGRYPAEVASREVAETVVFVRTMVSNAARIRIRRRSDLPRDVGQPRKVTSTQIK
jgi:hypothetical protein